MFFHPYDALPLPPQPSLEQYKKRAKDLLKAYRDADPAALRTWAAAWVHSLVELSGITFTAQLPVRINHWTDQLENFAREKLSATATLTAAQFVIARAHGFESWPQFAKHLESIARANSPENSFELAADALVAGDLATLEKLLTADSALIHARSSRRHQATLLHYVAANGVEGFRQKTPNNIVEIATLLLQAGAEVNAIADVYGGSTTLSLVATSVHPERAGVQEALLQLLIDHGATLDPGLLSACLANGRLHAAEFLAQCGAPLDLESAAGLGRLDVVQRFFDKNATRRERALLWASEYGRNPIVEFLLDRGVPIQAQANTGQTALHWAVIGAHADTVTLLLKRGADLAAKNIYGGTPLDQAEWCALHGDSKIDYAQIAALLKRHGAKE
jgi:ankyrin repeat protein